MGAKERATRQQLVARLRQRIDAIPAYELNQGSLAEAGQTGGATAIDLDALSFGCSALDEALPWRGLRIGALHEIVAREYRDRPAAMGFASALAARLMRARTGPVLWVQLERGFRDFGPVHGAGLAAMGIDPGRLIIATARDETDVLWAMEEGLYCPALAGVLGEVRAHARAVDLTASRRLQIAANLSDRMAFLLRGAPDEKVGMDGLGGSAALTRWAVASAPSARLGGVLWPLDTAIGHPCWRIELLRCRFGTAFGDVGTGDSATGVEYRGSGTMTRIVEWNHETHCFDLAAPLANRPVLSRPAPYSSGWSIQSGRRDMQRSAEVLAV